MRICLCTETIKILFKHLRKTKSGKGIIRMIKARGTTTKEKIKHRRKKKSSSKSHRGKKKVSFINKNTGKRVTFWVKR